MVFKDLFSHPEILQAIEESGYSEPTPIQAKAIPEVLKGSDLRASAQTGTGKTAAFILPSLPKLLSNAPRKGKGPKILILVPTRELAMQVATEAKKYSKYIPKARTVCIYGGAPYPMQNRDLARPYEILVATPGRLIDHMERKKIDFSSIEIFILDEADRMLDMGFIDDVKHISASMPATKQTLMFSATLKGPVLELSKKLLKDPVEVSVAPEKVRTGHIEQKILEVSGLEQKYEFCADVFTSENFTQAIVFTSTKRQAEELSEKLADDGWPAAALHGDMRQRQRTRTIKQLRDGDVNILVATDVAARGIDIPTISHVVNFDLPTCTEDYVHRIGRTGRAGSKGVAVTFVKNQKDILAVRRIEEFTGEKILPESLQIKTLRSAKPRQENGRPRRSGGGGFGKRNGNGPSFGNRSSGSGFGSRKGKSNSQTSFDNPSQKKKSNFFADRKKKAGPAHFRGKS